MKRLIIISIFSLFIFSCDKQKTTHFIDSGNVSGIENYKFGLPHGEWINYLNDNGQITSKEIYYLGNIVTQSFYYDNGQLESETKYNWWNHNIESDVSYYENGQIVTEGMYKDGEKIENGLIIMKMDRKNGYKIIKMECGMVNGWFIMRME